MELKNKDIQLNLLRKDSDGNFTNTGVDLNQQSDIINEYNKKPEKIMENLNETLLNENKDLPNANISLNDFTDYIWSYLTRCIPLGFSRLLPIFMSIVT